MLRISVGLWFEQEGDETGDPETSYTKLIAVHAGLESQSVEEQMQMLRTKDSKLPRIEPLAGRRNVWDTPPVRESSLTLLKSVCSLLVSSSSSSMWYISFSGFEVLGRNLDTRRVLERTY
jgi:hypothetical protein